MDFQKAARHDFEAFDERWDFRNEGKFCGLNPIRRQEPAALVRLDRLARRAAGLGRKGTFQYHTRPFPPPERPAAHSIMQLLFDFLPIIAFFVAYKFTDIFVATIVIIVAVVLQTGYQWLRHRKVNPMMLVSGALVLVFGSLTLILHDEMFIKWKVTVVYWLFAVAFMLSKVIGKEPLIQRALGSSLQLPQRLWSQLNIAYVIFFTFLGALNLYVTYHYDTNTWAKFKLFGLFGLMLVFVLAQSLWLSVKVPDEPPQTPEAK